MAKPKPSPSSGTLNSSAVFFGIGMFVVGLVLGRLMGGGSPDPADVAPSTAQAPAPPVTPSVEGGTLKRLSDQEKKEILARKNAAATKSAAPPAVIATPEGPFTSPGLLASFEDAITRAEYTRAVSFMDQGNARSARPLLNKLWGGSEGKVWRDPLSILLARASIDLGEIDSGRAMVKAWRGEFPKSEFGAHGVFADGRAFMQEGKRLAGGASGPDPKQRASYAAAIAQFDDAAKRWPADPIVAEGLFNKSAMLGELKDLAGAEQAALTLVSSFPTARLAPRALYNAAKASQTGGDNDSAERLYQRLVDDFPKERLARTARGELQALAVLGKPAPGIEVVEVLGEDPGTIESMKGKVVVLVFWATWCPHCRKEMPKLEEQWARWRDKGVQVVAVTRHTKGQTSESVRTYMDENSLTYPVVVDAGGTSRAYNVSGIPAAAIVGKDGTVVFRNHPAQITDALIDELVKS